MKLRLLFPAILFLFIVSLRAEEIKPLPVAIKNSNPAILYMGRVSDDYRSSWTGTGLKFKFKGTAAQAELQGRKVAFQVVVDGKPTKVIMLESGKTLYDLANDLKDGEHTIELFRRNEAYFPVAKYLGLRLNEGGEILNVKPSKLKLMVIGDSITCGYANEAKDLNTGNTEKNENGYMSYVPIAARKFGMDIMMICWSGRGMYRNRSMKNDQENTLPKMFDNTLADDKVKWDHQKFIPNVIAINLGTNDVENYKGKKTALKKEDFLGAYRKFITRLHKLYPKAQFIVGIGPMMQGDIYSWLQELEKDADYIHSIHYTNPGGKAWLGGHWHPAVKLDEKMGKDLADKINTVLGLAGE